MIAQKVRLFDTTRLVIYSVHLAALSLSHKLSQSEVASGALPSCPAFASPREDIDRKAWLPIKNFLDNLVVT